MRVLATDNDETMLATYVQIFRHFPEIEPNFAGTIDEFRQATKEQQFDVFFIDYDLDRDDETGLDLLREAKEKCRDAKFFIATSHCDLRFERRCLRSGAKGLIPKNDKFVPLVCETIKAAR